MPQRWNVFHHRAIRATRNNRIFACGSGRWYPPVHFATTRPLSGYFPAELMNLFPRHSELLIREYEKCIAGVIKASGKYDKTLKQVLRIT